ncbi:MAG: S24/S26 family peptidase [Prevotella sp.]|jgi:hypothetical protein|nr:S24/S26 family peptidase [Prevotella sp.]
MRELDTREYISTLRDLVNEGHEVSLIVSGSSMSPFLIHHRDTIIFGPVEGSLRRGDMVFYERPSGQYVMHRVRRVRPEGLYLIGDAQTQTEGPLSPSCVFAIVKAVRRNGLLLDDKSWQWRFFATIWLRVIPLRPLIIKFYKKISLLKRHD